MTRRRAASAPRAVSIRPFFPTVALRPSFHSFSFLFFSPFFLFFYSFTRPVECVSILTRKSVAATTTTTVTMCTPHNTAWCDVYIEKERGEKRARIRETDGNEYPYNPPGEDNDVRRKVHPPRRLCGPVAAIRSRPSVQRRRWCARSSSRTHSAHIRAMHVCTRVVGICISTVNTTRAAPLTRFSTAAAPPPSAIPFRKG